MDMVAVVGLRYLGWLQGALNVLIGLFFYYRLLSNVTKSSAMTCQMGTLRSRMSEEAVERWCTETEATYHKRLRRQIPYLDCGVELTVWLMMAHIWRMHGMEP